MSKQHRFLVCEHCGNLVGMIHDAGVKIMCCGQPMTELVANTSDGAAEKHVPVATVSGDTVTVSVGSTLHPMTEEHFIDWIYLQTAQGGQRKNVCRDGKPEVTFALSGGDKPVAVFAYCNLHGLWKADL